MTKFIEVLRVLQNSCKYETHHDELVLTACDLATAKAKKDILQAKLDNQ